MSEIKQLINSAEEMIKDGDSPEKVLNALLTDLKAYEKCNGWIPVSYRKNTISFLRNIKEQINGYQGCLKNVQTK